MFFRSKCTHADVYDTLLKRWTDMDARITRLELNEDNLRNMARKIQRGKPEEETKDLNSSTGGLLVRGKLQK